MALHLELVDLQDQETNKGTSEVKEFKSKETGQTTPLLTSDKVKT